MATTTIEDVQAKISELSESERTTLRRWLDQPQPQNGEEKQSSTHGKRGYVSPNTIWLRDHSSPYAGQYVALENGELVATGKGYLDTRDRATKAGSVRPLITYVNRADEELFMGGWQ